MSRVYIISKKSDRICYDTQAINMIKDILILWSIYEEYTQNECAVDEDQFIEYYRGILGQASIFSEHRFAYECKYYNHGIKMLRELCKQNGIVTYGRRLKKICYTNHNMPIFVPKNTASILDVLFEKIFQNSVLKNAFVNEILCNCAQYTINAMNVPNDCTIGILGFASTFLNHIDLDMYSQKYVEIKTRIYNTIARALINFRIPNLCRNHRVA